jgi:hypothetical protein
MPAHTGLFMDATTPGHMVAFLISLTNGQISVCKNDDMASYKNVADRIVCNAPTPALHARHGIRFFSLNRLKGFDVTPSYGDFFMWRNGDSWADKV